MGTDILQFNTSRFGDLVAGWSVENIIPDLTPIWHVVISEQPKSICEDFDKFENRSHLVYCTFVWFILGHVDEANQITVIIDKEETTIEFVDTEEKMV